jgi:hypothetical protein
MYINLIISVTGGNLSVRTICHLRHIKYDFIIFCSQYYYALLTDEEEIIELFNYLYRYLFPTLYCQ